MAELVLLSLVDQANCRCELKSLDGEVLGVVCLSREALGKVFTEQAEAIEWDGVILRVKDQLLSAEQNLKAKQRGISGWDAYLQAVSKSSISKRIIGGRDCIKRAMPKSETWDDAIYRAAAVIRSTDKNERNRRKDGWIKYIYDAGKNGQRRSRWNATFNKATETPA
jgi:hypothetical protein